MKFSPALSEMLNMKRLGLVYIVFLISICMALSFFLLGYTIRGRDCVEEKPYFHEGAVFNLLERQSTFSISSMLESSEEVLIKYRSVGGGPDDWSEKVLSISEQFDLAQLLRNSSSEWGSSAKNTMYRYDLEMRFNIKGGELYMMKLRIIDGAYNLKKKDLNGVWVDEDLTRNSSFVSICCSFLRGIGVNFEYGDAPSEFFKQSRKNNLSTEIGSQKPSLTLMIADSSLFR